MSNPATLLIIVLVFAFVYFLWDTRVIRPRRNSTTDRRFHKSTLVSVLLNLDEKAVNELLELYKIEFGKGAARYAKRTYKKWKSGEVQPATQTFERFLVNLPRVMSYDLKCEILRLFMEEYATKEEYSLEVYTDDWEEKLAPLVRQIIDRAFTAQLPAAVERKLQWLGEGDMQVAQSLLRSSQAEEGKIMVSMLREEFDSIDKLLAEEHLKPKVSHVLRFPYGTIELSIKRR